MAASMSIMVLTVVRDFDKQNYKALGSVYLLVSSSNSIISKSDLEEKQFTSVYTHYFELFMRLAETVGTSEHISQHGIRRETTYRQGRTWPNYEHNSNTDGCACRHGNWRTNMHLYLQLTCIP
jgi:hypothetical protein